jgi:hypothetical protein
MIRYSLKCTAEHGFESWFRDGESFDALASAGHLSCPECGSNAVSKALMAPAVVTSRKRAIAMPKETEAAPAPAPAIPVTLGDEKAQMMRALLRELRDHVVQHARDVGAEFASEARRMHEGETEQAAIRGTAAPDEVRALLEDGIEVLPVPVFPEDRN